MKSEDKARLRRLLDSAKSWARIDTHPMTGGCRRVVLLWWRRHGSATIEIKRIAWVKHIRKDDRADNLVRELKHTGFGHKIGIWEQGVRVWPVRPQVVPMAKMPAISPAPKAPSVQKTGTRRKRHIPMK